MVVAVRVHIVRFVEVVVRIAAKIGPWRAKFDFYLDNDFARRKNVLYHSYRYFQQIRLYMSLQYYSTSERIPHRNPKQSRRRSRPHNSRTQNTHRRWYRVPESAAGIPLYMVINVDIAIAVYIIREVIAKVRRVLKYDSARRNLIPRILRCNR